MDNPLHYNTCSNDPVFIKRYTQRVKHLFETPLVLNHVDAEGTFAAQTLLIRLRGTNLSLFVMPDATNISGESARPFFY